MIRLAIGVPGAGKSICLQDCARNSVAEGWPVFAIDRAGEWFESETVRWRNAPPPIRHILTQGEAALLLDERKRSNAVSLPPAVYVFNGFEPESVAALGLKIGNVIVCDDEIDVSCPMSGKWRENPFREYCHRGRHTPNMKGEICEVHLWGAARRIQNVHTDVTSLADEVFIFRVAGNRTIDRLVEEYALTPEQANECRTLPDLNYFRWSAKGDGNGNHLRRGYLTGLELDPAPDSDDQSTEVQSMPFGGNDAPDETGE